MKNTNFFTKLFLRKSLEISRLYLRFGRNDKNGDGRNEKKKSPLSS